MVRDAFISNRLLDDKEFVLNFFIQTASCSNCNELFDSKNGNPEWIGLNDQRNLSLYSTDKVLKVNTAFTVDDVLVIPQTTSFITIVYTQKASAANPEITMEYKAQLTGGENDAATDLIWHYGKHYTYSISIAADEIKIDPNVKEWTIINKQINVE